MGLALTATTAFLAIAALVFMGNSVSLSTTNATLSPVRTEASAQTAWAPTVAPALWDTMDRTVR